MDSLVIDDKRTIPNAEATARTYQEGIKFLQQKKWSKLYLDHDLGCFDEHGREWTGYDVLCWLEVNQQYLPVSIVLLTNNGSVLQKMMRLIDKLYFPFEETD